MLDWHINGILAAVIAMTLYYYTGYVWCLVMLAVLLAAIVSGYRK